MQVQSEPGVGSVFSFTISFEIAEEAKIEPLVMPEQLNSLRALVVDDNSTALQIYSTLMRDFHFEVDTAASGAEALYKLGKQETDLLLIDWMMPEMDGREVIRTLDEMVADGRISKRPVVIMMTAYAAEPLAQEVEDANVFALLQKPFKASTLFDEIISAFAEKPHPATVAEITDNQSGGHKGLVLLVEDNLINQQVASELLRSAGYEVDLADNGQIALEMVEQRQYDAVLMDIQMPVMDGLTATRELRKKYDRETLPIIAMTAHAMSGDREKSLAAGMNAHITKPIMLNELFDTLSEWVGRT